MASIAELKSVGLGLNGSRKYFELLWNHTRTLEEALLNKYVVLIYDVNGFKKDHLLGDIGTISVESTGLWLPVESLKVKVKGSAVHMPSYNVSTPYSKPNVFTDAKLGDLAYVDVLSAISTGNIFIPIDLGDMHKRIEISEGCLTEHNPEPEERIVFVRPNSNITTKADDIDEVISNIAPEVVGYAEDFVKRYLHPRFH